jgi:hypothetical protein
VGSIGERFESCAIRRCVPWLAGLVVSLCCSCTLPDVSVRAQAGSDGSAVEADDKARPTSDGGHTAGSGGSAGPVRDEPMRDAAVADAETKPAKEMSGGGAKRDAAVNNTPGGSGTPQMPLDPEDTAQPDGGMNQPEPPAAGSGGPPVEPPPTQPPPAANQGPLTGESSCLANITAYAEAGPFQFETSSNGAINFWVPQVPAACRVPVIHFANGTSDTCSSARPQLERYATHGFITTCYENPNTGAGGQAVEALQAAVERFPDLAAQRFGSTGVEQGGQAAFVTVALAEKHFGLTGSKFAGLPIMPSNGFGSQPEGGWQEQYAAIVSPVLVISGRGITASAGSAEWGQTGVDTLHDGVEAYHWSKDGLQARSGASALPVPNDASMQVGPAWFRWKLLDDMEACRYFKAIPMNDPTWEEVDAQSAVACQ